MGSSRLHLYNEYKNSKESRIEILNLLDSKQKQIGHLESSLADHSNTNHKLDKRQVRPRTRS